MAFAHNLCFLFVFLLAISFTNVKADLIHDICARTLHPTTCSQLLGSDPRSKTSNLLTLGFVAIDVATKQAKCGVSLASSLLKEATNQKLKEIYSSCLENYSDSLDDLKQLPGFLRSKDYGSVGSYGFAALDGPDTCDGNFSSHSAEPPQLKGASDKLQAICSVVLAINRQLQGH